MRKILIGKIVNTFGLKGELKIMSDSDFKMQRFEIGNTLLIDNEEYIVKTYRKHKGFDIVSFEKYQDINIAEKLKGKDVYAYQLESDLGEDEYYFYELEGMEVVENEVIGIVKEVRSNPGNSILVVDVNGNNKLIPFVDEFILDVDKKNKVIKIKSIEGLL